MLSRRCQQRGIERSGAQELTKVYTIEGVTVEITEVA